MNQFIDIKKLIEIKARISAATRGPWRASIEGKDHSSGSSCLVLPHSAIDLDGATDNDIEFMAHAREDIPYLVEEVERLARLLSQQKNGPGSD